MNENQRKAQEKYRLTHKKELRERKLAYRIKNKDKEREYQTRYLLGNREIIRERRRPYYQQYGLRPQTKYRDYKSAAKIRGIEFLLTYEQFYSFWQNRCYYCGVDIETIGLDRINNRQGYSPDNLVSCCKTCNLAKREMPIEEFRDWLSRFIGREVRFNGEALKCEVA